MDWFSGILEMYLPGKFEPLQVWHDVSYHKANEIVQKEGKNFAEGAVSWTYKPASTQLWVE